MPLDEWHQLRPENQDSPIRTYGESAPELLQESMKDLSLKPRHAWATETVMFTVNNPLFKVDAALKNDLDRGYLSERLRQQFKENNITLSQNVTITIEEKGKKWLMVDAGKKQMYPIRVEGDQPNVFKSLFYSSRDPLELPLLE